ncbi:hypothetical protein CEUSTIGMA_g4862.t1 [Chlamydomonas eustigma]|uniref:Uncharacterized protein n=1 Tax=Chlamydomonas eustigma TaxID=1157962 RepID=A0A250X2W6_9CHLO|nr:hypothetical protein CEUSTIGMA_g4862.t1 [Chlamydomonas eustigma]|eukprot:GAX77417.1 hypothetical protein CEUSTIGMA_g4862.t1 [Chlamydomonas eustigma]
MHHNNSFVKQTKKGKVLKVVREHYLRDDIWSGSPLDPECDPSSHKLSTSAKHYLLIDTNVALHQIDFLEHPAICDVVVCSIVLEEVKHKNQSAYQRLRALCSSPTKRFYVFANEHHRETFIQTEPSESPNDRNDRAIRVATKWYASRLNSKMPVVLLTNDADNRRKAVADGLDARGVYAYALELKEQVPEIIDLVAASSAAADEDDEAAGSERATSSGSGANNRAAKRKKIYAEHVSYSAIAAGIKDGRFHQGSLRVSRFNPFEGFVGSESVGQDILISGRVDMNRALDGDIVAVELLPEDQWRSDSAQLPGSNKGDNNNAASGHSVEGGEEEDDPEAESAGAELFQVAPGEHYEDRLLATGGKGAGERRPTGRVVGVIKRNWRARGYCGSLKPLDRSSHGTSSVLFMPVERRYPMIRIQTRQADTLMDKRMVVAIDSWECDSMYPSGHYVRTLGTIGDKETETEVLLIENDIITTPFTPAVHDCVPPLPWKVTDAELSDPVRRDLRDLIVCSVDPPGCKDIDDALHARSLPNGNIEVGVHIADVTHFLKPETAMDAEAALRGTTVYLVQRRLDMLPKPLTEDICSLRGGVERLAFSVLWEMTQDADIVSATFTKSVIRSSAALTYAEAQARMDDDRLQDELTLSLRTLNRLGKILRLRRAERGALQLASPEVKFVIDTETLNPLDVGMYQVREANQMVEEMMLLANISVAEKIVQHFPSCSLLRRHPTPAPRQFEPVVKAAAAAGFALEIDSSKALAASLDQAVKLDDPYFNKLIRIMTTRCMTQAVYFGSGDLGPPEYHHYGLASQIYTHFTSPIRRYADVVVHRLLAAALGLQALPDSARDRDGLRGCSDNLNKRHHNAQMAGRASVELHTLIFFNGRTVVADARITKVKTNGLIVFVPKFGIEGPVYLTPSAARKNSKADAGKQKSQNGSAAGGGSNKRSNDKAGAVEEEQGFILDEETQSVASRDGSTRYAVFEPCAVRITVEEGVGHRKQLVLSLVPREELNATDRVGA